MTTRWFRRTKQPPWIVRECTVMGRRMRYLELGSGAPVVLLHGSVGSSEIWSRVLQYVGHEHCAVAPDLIGTGRSERIMPVGPMSYSLEEHRQYFSGFLDIVGIHKPIVLILHGWASMIGFDWAARHPSRVRGICHFESIVRPLGWVDLLPTAREMLKTVRSEAGERYVLDSDAYLKHTAQQQVAIPIRGEAFDSLSRSFGIGRQGRMATYAALRSIPIAGLPTNGQRFVRSYWEWLETSDVPKLYIRANPGYLMGDRLVASASRLQEQTTVAIAGSHLLQLDSPDGVGAFIRAWLHRL